METSENVGENANESRFDMTRMAPPSPPPRRRKPLTDGQIAHIQGKMGDYELPDILTSYRDFMKDVNKQADGVMNGYLEDFCAAMNELLGIRYAVHIKSSFARVERERLEAFKDYKERRVHGKRRRALKSQFKEFPKLAVYSSTDEEAQKEAEAKKLKKSKTKTQPNKKPRTPRANRRVTFSEDTFMEDEEEEEPEPVPKKGRRKTQARTETIVEKPKHKKPRAPRANRRVTIYEDTLIEDEEEEEEPEPVPTKGRKNTQARTEKPKRATRKKATTSVAPAKPKIRLPRGKIN